MAADTSGRSWEKMEIAPAIDRYTIQTVPMITARLEMTEAACLKRVIWEMN